MPANLRFPAILVAALALGVVIGLATGLFNGDGEDAGETTAAERPLEPKRDRARPPEPGRPERDEPAAPIDRDDEPGVDAGPSGPRPASSGERAAAAAVRRYVRALDGRDGEAVCRLLSPGAVAALDFPEERGGCPASVEASLGFRDPRGFPVWKGATITEDISAAVDGSSARVVATVVTTYADVREPTVEDDIVYLEAAGENWRLAKPSATILRAIGQPDFGPSVLAPPR